MSAAPAGQRPRKRFLSPITWRILGVNFFALAILVGELLYLGEYQRGLIQAERNAISIQADMVAAALAESGTTAENEDDSTIDLEKIPPLVRRLARTTSARVRLFRPDGALLVDSRLLLGPGGVVQVESLPPPPKDSGWFDQLAGPVIDLYVAIANWLPSLDDLPPYVERPVQRASDYPEVMQALAGDEADAVRAAPGGLMIISAAVPVQRYKKVMGGLLLSRDSHEIDAALYEVRRGIIAVFAVSLMVTILLSLYLASTIARPLRRLAAAAEQVRHGHNRQYSIPDFASRHDEIGELAHALRDMTEALWTRMDAIEGFAADVAHEIKNPLTSIRSAVETLTRVKDPEHQRRLMAVILDDVERLNLLISGISDASRLDAELSRMDQTAVDLLPMMETLINMHEATAGPDSPRLVLEAAPTRRLLVNGMESRLVQVFRNLIANALSFSPPGGTVTLRALPEGGWIRIEVEDEGPGIPEGKEEAIFQRFYSERPAEEKFGTHSGLGLSISRQIVEAHDGTVGVENLRTDDGRIRGCRFVVRLPAA